MEENFSLLAQSRANYYTPGSPVQFVRVELLRGDESGQIAVCLTFKNIGPDPVAGLTIKFRCKNRQGEISFEDKFYYEGLSAAQGDLFGNDDAVYVSDEPIGSVDVELDSMTLASGKKVDLSQLRRTRLPGPRALPKDLSEALCKRTGKPGMGFVPQVIEQGWYCACGAFHPKAEDTVYCSECGSDRILLQNALSGMLQKAKAEAEAAHAAPADSGTRVIDREEVQEPAAHSPETADEPTAMYDAARPAETPRKASEKQTKVYQSEKPSAPAKAAPDYEEETEGPDDALAANIIRWAPPITIILCALVVAFTLVYHFVAQ